MYLALEIGKELNIYFTNQFLKTLFSFTHDKMSQLKHDEEYPNVASTKDLYILDVTRVLNTLVLYRKHALLYAQELYETQDSDGIAEMEKQTIKLIDDIQDIGEFISTQQDKLEAANEEENEEEVEEEEVEQDDLDKHDESDE